jgi:hypothetical protein
VLLITWWDFGLGSHVIVMAPLFHFVYIVPRRVAERARESVRHLIEHINIHQDRAQVLSEKPLLLS